MSFKRLQELPLERPFLTLLLVSVLVAIAAAGVKDMTFNNDPRFFFSEDSEAYKRFERLESQYNANDMVLFIVHPDNGDVFTRRNLEVLEKLTEAAWGLPKTVRADSLANFQHTRVEGDTLNVRPLVEDAPRLSAQRIERIREIALNEPSLVNSRISESGHVASVAATVALDQGRKKADVVADAAKRIRDQFRERYPDVRFMVTGTVIFSEAMGKASRQAMTETAAYSMLAATGLLLLLLRSFVGTALTLALVIFANAAALGLATWAGLRFQPISGFAPAIILTLGIADCMHILVSFYQLRSQQWAKGAAVRESLRINRQPVVLTSVTTAIGFVCLNVSESPPFRDLGNTVAAGVMLAMVLSLTVLPALLMLLPDGRHARRRHRAENAMRVLGDWIIAQRRALLVGMSAFIVAAVAFIPANQLHDVWNEYFDDSFEVRRANDFMVEHLTGMARVEFSVPAKGSGGITQPDYLHHLEAFSEWLASREDVVYTASFTQVMKRLNRDMHQGQSRYYQVPDSPELAAQYLLMYELSLPRGQSLDNQITMDKDATRVIAIMDSSSSQAVVALERSAVAWMKENWPSYMQTRGTGMDVLFAGITQRNIKSMLTGTLGALLVISFTLTLALRSVRYGLLSFLPNMVPALVAFGLWGLLDGRIGISDSIVACLTIGIVVDDTVHFLSKYVRARREQGLSAEAAVRYAFSTVGVALVSTSLILVACFGFMVTSHFEPNASMGLLTSLTVGIALVVDFLFFVPLLLTLDRRQDPKEAAAAKTDEAEPEPAVGAPPSTPASSR